jgi:hypothetical protein
MAKKPVKKATHDRTKKNFSDPNDHRAIFKVIGRNPDGLVVELTKSIDYGGPRGKREKMDIVIAEKDIPALKAAIDNAQQI